MTNTRQRSARMRILRTPLSGLPRRGWSRGRSSGPILVALLLASLSAGCKDLTGSPGLPSGTANPGSYANKAGALGMRNAAVFQLEHGLHQYLEDAGLLTDELEDLRTGASAGVLAQGGGINDPLDERILPPGVTVASYSWLQGFRTAAAQARGALAAYDTAPADTATAKVLRGELYALEGYADILLADLFCSGVPLSTLDFQKDFTYAPSSTTTQVYQAALAKLDTALVLARASDSVVHLAQVLKGRAYLALNNYPVAADDVTTVPTGFRYMVTAFWNSGGGSGGFTNVIVDGTVSNAEGIHGVPFLNGDPRSAVDTLAQPGSNGDGTPFIPLTTPVKYRSQDGANPNAPFPLASGTEARLIEAEATLQRGDTATWLTDMNQLRTTGTTTTANVPDTLVDTIGYTGCTSLNVCDDNTGIPAGVSYAAYTLVDSVLLTIPDPSPEIDACRANTPNHNFPCSTPYMYIYADPAHTHQVTVWQAGTGGVAGLPPLTDPGTPAAQVALLFQERAYWLFLDGHRQGDLRRLLRQYNKPLYGLAFNDQSKVYPTGTYLAPGTGLYGFDVTAPIPTAEAANPSFHGCLSRDP
jgi:hypothetical protein